MQCLLPFRRDSAKNVGITLRENNPILRVLQRVAQSVESLKPGLEMLKLPPGLNSFGIDVAVGPAGSDVRGIFSEDELGMFARGAGCGVQELVFDGESVLLRFDSQPSDYDKLQAYLGELTRLGG